MVGGLQAGKLWSARGHWGSHLGWGVCVGGGEMAETGLLRRVGQGDKAIGDGGLQRVPGKRGDIGDGLMSLPLQSWDTF